MAFGPTDLSNFGYRPPVNGYPYSGYLYRHKRSNPWFKIALGMAIGATIPFAFTRLKTLKPISEFISTAFKSKGGNIKEFFRGLFKYGGSAAETVRKFGGGRQLTLFGPAPSRSFTGPVQLSMFGHPTPQQLSLFPRQVVRSVKRTMRHPGRQLKLF